MTEENLEELTKAERLRQLLEQQKEIAQEIKELRSEEVSIPGMAIRCRRLGEREEWNLTMEVPKVNGKAKWTTIAQAPTVTELLGKIPFIITDLNTITQKAKEVFA